MSRVDRPRLRQHHPRRPRRHGRHHARPPHGAGITTAALHDADPRQACQPPLPAGRRRRRPRTASSDPTPSRRAPRPKRCSRSSPATKHRSPPAPCCASSTTPPPGCSMPSSATPTASTSPPSKPSDPRPSPTSTTVDQHIPGLTAEPAWPTLRTTCSPSPPKPATTPTATSKKPRMDVTFHRRRHGRRPRLATPSAPPTDPGPLPWIPGIPTRLQDHPVWGRYLAEAIPACRQTRRPHPRTSRPGRHRSPLGATDSHLSDKLLGEVAVWRAANGIDPSDPRPTGIGQLETMPSSWQNQLDRAIAGSVTSQPISTPAKPLAARALVTGRRHHHRSA